MSNEGCLLLSKGIDALDQQERAKSWLLKNKNSLPKDALPNLERHLAKVARYPGFNTLLVNLLRAQDRKYFYEHRWMLTVAEHLADRRLLRKLEVGLDNGRVIDILAETAIQGSSRMLYVEAKSWRFSPIADANDEDLSDNNRIARTIDKLYKQLPVSELGVWAWDKMRDVIVRSSVGAATSLGGEELDVIGCVTEAVPQIAAILINNWANLRAVPSLSSKWSIDEVKQLTHSLNVAPGDAQP